VECKDFREATDVIFDLVQIDRPSPDTLGRPRLEPPLVKLLVMNCYDIRNAAPLFSSGNDSESTIRSSPSEVVVNESNTVSVREVDIPRSQIEDVDRKSVDEIGIPVFSKVRVNLNTTKTTNSNDKTRGTEE
jgi:hypothetical protein